MEKQQSNLLQNFDDSKTEILKKRLLKSANTSMNATSSQNTSQPNVLLNTLRAPTPSSMIVSSMAAPQSSLALSHSLVTHSLAPVKIHTNNPPYPLQLSTVHVPVQIPGSTSNINVPVQISGPANSVPLQITPVSMPLQVSGTTTVPVQLPAGETINVPLQIPAGSQNIQLSGPTLPSMPLLQNTSQPMSSIIHVHMGANPRPTSVDGSTDMNVSSASQLQITDSSGMLKMSTPTSVSQVQMGSNPAMVQIPNSSNNSIQLTLPNTGSSGTVQLRGGQRSMPHVVYIQTPTGLKPVSSSEVISQASTSGNPPQIIVRRPVTSNPNIHLVSNKPNLAPKVTAKSSILNQPIVIQKPKSSDKMMVPVSLAPGPPGKISIAHLGIKKPIKQLQENQSILISNNQPNTSAQNQKLFLTPMMPKMQSTKFILPVTLPAMASKGPIINLQIANGQIQNDPQGNSITVMRDTGTMETSEMPPLQPLAKAVHVNGKDNSNTNNNTLPQSAKIDKSFAATSIPGSRAEPTGEQGEYTLSIPETNASMNDDIFNSVSISDEDGGQREKSFTLAIPEKSKSLLNKNASDKIEVGATSVAAPAILRRSNSDNSERQNAHANFKRRISLCAENLANKGYRLSLAPPKPEEQNNDTENNDDHRVPSLFCDEKLEEAKVNLGESDHEEYRSKPRKDSEIEKDRNSYYRKFENFVNKDRTKRNSLDSTVEEDPPGLMWSDGVATLKGSTLQFQTNEFGLIDVIDTSDQDDILMPSVKYHTPLKQRIERGSREKKPSSPEDMYRCDGCGCHGMAAEFITPNFCSLTCQSEVQRIANKKREREKLEVLKKRNKVKKLLMKKHLSESDMIIDGKEDKVPLKHYDSTPSEAQLADSKSDEFLENEKYPWMCGKNGFSWMRYLDVCKAKAAPVKLFKDPFPYTRNNFKVGMRMEAIDPEHPAVFCVVSVAEVQGYRIRLHFDEYPDVYDYWVNADCQDVFPAGWCERNGRSLRPPASYTPATFSWPIYLKQIRAVTAPRHLFPHVINATMIRPNGFRIGMKLEAEDRKNNLICVATIADMLENRLLINFDSWDEMYDYWVEPTSPHIHPVGWAEQQGRELTPPNYYKDPDSFSWESYLEETGASPAPPRAFKTRSPQGFKPGMKLEVVDPRVPFLIRVATISAVKNHQVLVSFDGWGTDLSVWMEDDSPDLHPVGWCLKTQHPLEPPLTPEELQVAGPCGVGGCRGLGSLRGGPHKQHVAASACPYRAPPPPLPDRLAPHAPAERVQPASRRVSTKSKPIGASTPNSDTSNTNTSKTKYGAPRGRPLKHKRVEEVVKNEVSDDESISSGGGGKRWRGSPRPLRTYSRHAPPPPLPPPPRLHCAAHIADLALPNNPLRWSQEDVAALITRIAGTAAGAAALSARLSGSELILASREELVQCARMRLGPAIKVYAAVRQLRETLA